MGIGRRKREEELERRHRKFLEEHIHTADPDYREILEDMLDEINQPKEKLMPRVLQVLFTIAVVLLAVALVMFIW